MSEIVARPSLKAVYSTVGAPEIAGVVEASYSLGAVAFCELIRRGFNDVYEVRFEDGRRCVARLAGLRARGPANSAYEAALLIHLQADGIAVATPLSNSSGAMWRECDAPEGVRQLMLFQWLDGAPPRADVGDVAIMGGTLARIHAAGETYGGPPSRYAYSPAVLRCGGLARLLATPAMDDPLRTAVAEIMTRLERDIPESSLLRHVACHGDCHGGNAFISTDGAGRRVAGFFDFDDAGPGPQAYDLAVYLWAHLVQARGVLEPKNLEAWTAYIAGYRAEREILPADYAAIAPYVRFRHLWFMGEYASRVPEWGMTSVSRDWLRQQVKLLKTWEKLPTPAG
jgi:Ser/Thr protein kinase RdoA (MazF antagonist)